VALAARRRWPDALVIGVDRKDIVERAMILRAIDVGADDLGMASEADLIVLAAPVLEICRLLESGLSGMVAQEAVVTDVGSTKVAIVRAAAALPGHLHFVGGHPLAGAATGGLEHARSDLFAGRPWCLCPESTGNLHRLDGFVEELGATPKVVEAAAHDRLVAFLSHLPQLVASALMEIVGEAVGEEGLGLAGRGLHDTTRLAGSPPDIWKDTCATNAPPLGEALDQLIARLQELRTGLGDGQVIERVFRSAQEWKRKMPVQKGPP
jgi:prephenate dehydrogenase